MPKSYVVLKRHKAKSRSLRNLVLVAAIVGPLMTLPQIYQIYSTKDAHGVSLWTWAFYCGSSSTWLFYGLKIKDKPLIISSFLWLLMEGAVAAGILIY